MIEIVYLASNRVEFTRTSFRLLRENTNWRLVSRLIVYDDRSTDGTDAYLKFAGLHVPVPAFEFREVGFGAPAATMNDYLATTEADLFVKVDNDIAVPPRWLECMWSVMKRNPRLEFLGMDGGRHGVADPWQPPRKCGYEEATHIGGVGMMRTRAFTQRPAIMARGRFGFTEWQHKWEPTRGWITPGLAVAQLDLIPEEPWRSLTEEYIARGWSRRWSPYSPLHPWWSWITDQIAEPEAA